MHECESLPGAFCWTRFGTEAGETIEAILERKEHERRMTGGVFLWGIGNSVAPGIAELVRRIAHPEVLFSPIKSRPRAVDVQPSAVVRWHGGVTPNGQRITLPETVRVMSRQSRAPHYALVCAAHEPLRPRDLGELRFVALKNLLSGNPLGASQVTAVVERLPHRDGGNAYVVALRARLVAPFFIRLVDSALESPGVEADEARAVESFGCALLERTPQPHAGGDASLPHVRVAACPSPPNPRCGWHGGGGLPDV